MLDNLDKNIVYLIFTAALSIISGGLEWLRRKFTKQEEKINDMNDKVESLRNEYWETKLHAAQTYVNKEDFLQYRIETNAKLDEIHEDIKSLIDSKANK